VVNWQIHQADEGEWHLCQGFTAAWAERTALYLSDIETVPPKTWKKIVVAAMKIVEEKRGHFQGL
jgi:hypothetical protein